MDVLKEVESVSSLVPIGPDESLSLFLYWGTRQPQSQQAAEASVSSLIFPSWINTYQAAQLCFKLERRIRPSPPQEAAKEGIWKTYTKLIQASDNLRMGGEGEGFIHFHDNSHREKKCSLASPQGLELNSQGCQSDQEFNTIYSVGSLSGASVSASGWCPEPAQAEQPESWICLAWHAVRHPGHMHRDTVSPSFMATQSWRVREACII